MARTTKAMLEQEVLSLREQVATLTTQLSAAPVTTVPSARVQGYGAISTSNPLLKGLPVYTPHSPIECAKHGAGRANKAGYCGKCCLLRIQSSRN